MAITGLRIPQADGIHNMLVYSKPFTAEVEDEEGEVDGVLIEWQPVEDDLTHKGDPVVNVFKMTEETFHKELREHAVENEHLITNWSSNPEWTPEGYSKIVEI